jgi:hypothetical protein
MAESASLHLILAGEHVQWVLERMLMAVLGWDLGKTSVDVGGGLQWATAMREWPDAKAALERDGLGPRDP